MCFGPLSATVERDGESGRLVEIARCKFCGKTYFWPEHQWSEPASDPTAIDVPEPKKTRALSAPIEVHVNVAA
jgi:hypothetical protein